MSGRRVLPAIGLLAAGLLAAPQGLHGQDAPAAAAPPGSEADGGVAEGAGDEAPPARELGPRALYNAGLQALGAGRLEDAAEQLLAARDGAGVDTELRYRAAYNLGLALAHRSDEVVAEDVPAAMDLLRQAAAWFRDAARLRPDDEDARVNLELVLRRVQLLADQLNSGKNSLEARLDRVIDDQRGLRDRVRALLTQVEAAGAGAEPVAFEPEYEALATFERTLLADAGTVTDLAGDELSLLEGKGEEERTEEERVRVVQLTNLDAYMQRARQSLSDARRELRRLDGGRAHRRAAAALEELKRARDQLLDPVTVLQGLVQEQTELLAHSQALESMERGALRLEGGAPVAAPPWLTAEGLATRQERVGVREGEVLARFSAGVSAADEPASDQDESPPPDADTQRALGAAREAIPHLELAAEAMRGATSALGDGRLGDALPRELDAISEMLEAIERFAGVRELIELLHRDQSRIVELIKAPPSEDGSSPLDSMSTGERVAIVQGPTAKNRERLERLEGLLQDERARLEREAAGGQPQAALAAGDPQADGQRRAAIAERYEAAEELRAAALQSIDALDGALRRVAEDDRDADAVLDAVDQADAAAEKIEELRRLFFTIVEHLEELLREQAESRDGTARLGAGDEAPDRTVELGLLADRQDAHATTGDALARALAEQADAAAAAPAGTTGAARQAEVLAEAAPEVRSAASEMSEASGLLAAARDAEEGSEPDLEPALEHQLSAMEHLEAAIRILRPHSDEPQEDEQQQPRPQPQDEELSQRQAERRLQEIREREAARDRERRERQRQRDPVERDW